MPRPPTTITIVRSRLGLLAQGLPALGVALSLAWQAPPWVSLFGTLAMGGVVADSARRRPVGALRMLPGDTGAPRWAWRESAVADWGEVALRCDYLGPWLIGLRLDGRRLWLWPDSSDRASLQALRRALVSLP